MDEFDSMAIEIEREHKCLNLSLFRYADHISATNVPIGI